jgi:SAM-dependent methyltransferase
VQHFKSQYTLEKIASIEAPGTFLDVGCGLGAHRDYMTSKGWECSSIDILPLDRPRHIVADIMETVLEPESYDVVWASHYLEHTLNPHDFLLKLKDAVKPGGTIGICVPPLKHQIVGGHLNLFNPGLLMYRLVRAGLDCNHIKIKCQGYNIGAILPVRKVELPRLKNDCGDIETLAPFFPAPFRSQGFNGQIAEFNWR